MTQKAKNKVLTVKITESELAAIAAAGNNLSAMIGGGDDEEFEYIVKKIDTFLKKNGYKRTYN